jgi:hypothetical protein
MRPSLALSIGAVFAILPGLVLVIAPAETLSAFGWPGAPNAALVPERDSGVLLIGVGVIDWLARNALGAPLRGLLWGNIFIRVAALAVNGWDLAAGMLPPNPRGVLGGAFGVLSLASIVMFALALRNAQEG